MNRYLFLLFFILSSFISQETFVHIIVSDTARLSESLFSMKKRKMVMDIMDMSEAEKSSFWPLYESYCQTIRYIELETLEIIDVYHRFGKTLSQKEAEQYAKRIVQNDHLLAKVRKQFHRKFTRALSTERADQFMEFDDQLRSMIRFEVRKKAEAGEVAQASLR